MVEWGGLSTKMDVEKILERIDNLDKLGEQIRHTARLKYPVELDNPMRMSVESGGFTRWRIGCLSLLGSLSSPNDIYLQEFQEVCKEAYLDDLERGLGVVRALRDGVEGGYLQKVETLVSAEVFDNLLDMAEHLLDSEYKDPAASLAGAVLEDSLRRICRNNDITVKNDDNIGSLNQKLFQKTVYGKPQMKQVVHWQSIRDSADHGKFEEYNAETVKNMLEGVRNFLASQLSLKGSK